MNIPGLKIYGHEHVYQQQLAEDEWMLGTDSGIKWYRPANVVQAFKELVKVEEGILE